VRPWVFPSFRLSLGDVLDRTMTWALAHSRVSALLEKKCRTSQGVRAAIQLPRDIARVQMTYFLVFSRSGEILADTDIASGGKVPPPNRIRCFRTLENNIHV
jgi:hypothetical protein